MRSSKEKWVGGLPGLGYDIDKASKKLIINSEEAALVRRIFKLYLEGNSLLTIVRILNSEGLRTKKYPGRKKNPGGVLFRSSNIQILLKNPTYMGKIRYEKKLYPGLHEPIVSEDTFLKVQDLLKKNWKERGVTKNRKFPGLLTGLLRCVPCNSGMAHTYAMKKNYKYRYYICLYAINQGREKCPTKSITASAIEEKCLNFIIQLTKDKRLADETWATLPVEKQSEILKQLVRGIEYDGHNGKLWIELVNDFTKHEFDLPLDQLNQKLPDTAGIAFANELLIRKQLLLAHQIQGMLANGRAKDLQQIAGWLGLSKTRLEQITNLLFLCPAIQEEIICGDTGRLNKMSEYKIRSIVQEVDWARQTSLWRTILT